MKNFLLVVALALAIGATLAGFSGRAPTADFTKFGSLLGSLLFASAILERSLDVLLSMLKGATADQLDTKIRAAKQNMAAATAVATRQTVSPVAAPPADAVETASGALTDLMVERTGHQDATRMIAAPMALVVGVVLSSIGLRSLQPLFEPSDAAWLKSTQGRLFSFVDIVLTAALLAGGSEGIHWMVALYRDWTDKNRSSKS